MREVALPPSDEPVDFRRQAAIYARYRRDYSPALYDAIGEHTGPPRGRLAVDLGCGTGFVATTLRRRGWKALGVDFSAPMLAEARRLGDGLPLASARAEALPVREASAGLVACGTAFHWFAPAPALVEIERVLAPGGTAAFFWRYDAPGEPYMRLVGEALRAAGVAVPDGFHGLTVHPAEPFGGSGLLPDPPRTLAGELAFTAESFHGYVATLEWVRRFAGARHADFLDRLRAALADRWPDGFRERVVEHLYLARKPV